MVDVNRYRYRLLPPELERLIFETAAELYPETIPNLLLVAVRVLEWIEPLKYRTFTLTVDPSTCPQFRLLQQTVKSKPVQFIHDNIRYLLADQNFPAGSLDEVLPGCTGVISLALFHTHPSMVSQLEAIRPQRLSAPIASFFDHDTVDLTLPLFSSLTHLDAFDVFAASSWSDWSSLALLPVLTHLAFLDLANLGAEKILAACRKLQVLIGMHEEFFAVQTRDDMDPRFLLMVLSTEDYVVDWKIGVQGGMDFWARADAFVAKRRRGEIEPKSRYWIEDEDGI
ncbi:hypothetical protein DFH08DRAFT_391013 [Mycena albidolilacea]|uniref:Uncharacterized protein n=1 Tax=Mycena albidolilacea TaxID=1033008 RepID=A0AAD6ZG04_9AGAR|nr:hypothetical protein DFH08DRAFT_391013 [Mycena albidolilacea]